ncbi:MAG: DUF6320 domain-containing protein [Eubacteriales bacterium]|nr:DUF6320 domain-containing protein [Eubacteriales bacterium]
MLEFGYSQWRKLDNAALAFPAVTGKNDTRVFRFYCQIKEEVDGEILQKALDSTMEKFPLFQAVLRKGLFWFYLERRELKAIVREEEKPPCSKLYIPDKKTLLFEVTYYKKRINFEVFHALTDGTGAMCFLQELVINYLQLAHPQADLPLPKVNEEVTGKDQEEDSFSQYYSAEAPRNKEKKRNAVQLKGEKLAQDEMHIMEVVLPVKETLAKAREYGVSITVMLTAMMLCAINEEVPRSHLHKPVALMVPVNLRNYFPSQSMANFFGWIEVGYEFKEDTAFLEVLEHVKQEFEKELVKERIAMRMNELVRLEKNPFLRAVPLEVKRFFLLAGTNFGGRSITAVYSNVGVIRLPEQYKDYIERFGLFASTNSLQMCSCSYGNELVLGFTSKVPSDNIQRNFLKMLKSEEVPYQEEENDFPGYRKEPGNGEKKIFETFTFLCIAAAVICSMINYMLVKRLDWSWFVAGGCLCTWILVTVAYKKRRNILKNEMWQLLLVSGIGVLWDVFTGWHGWSVDFVIPLASLGVLTTIPVIAKVRHLETAEYLFYLIQAALFGLIPIILMFTGVVKIPYPSIICAGISFLVLMGLLLFSREDMMREIHKKLRM